MMSPFKGGVNEKALAFYALTHIGMCAKINLIPDRTLSSHLRENNYFFKILQVGSQVGVGLAGNAS
jgi:hypothetical protein